MAHLDHGCAENDRVVIVISGNAGVIVALLIVQGQDGGFAVMLEGIDEIHGAHAQHHADEQKGHCQQNP